MIKLYSYYRSSASYRVRIALALKKVEYQYVAIDLSRGDQTQVAYQELSGNGLVPILEVNGVRIAQSLAIIEYLDDMHLSPPLLPNDSTERAVARAIAQSIACDLHPLNNLRVLRYLESTLQHNEAEQQAWYRHWTRTGLEIVENQLQQAKRRDDGPFSLGKLPSLVDCVLIPQIYNARRFKVSLDGLDRILKIDATCRLHPSFEQAVPENCPDYPEKVHR